LVTVPQLSASAIANRFPDLHDLYCQVCYPGTYVPNLRLREMVASEINMHNIVVVRSKLRSKWTQPDSYRSIEGGSETMVVDVVLQLLLGVLATSSPLSVAKCKSTNNFLAKSNNAVYQLVYMHGKKPNCY
jgi:hypothetical protein